MKTRPPTAEEIEELVSFLPQLYGDGLTPIRRWGGGTKDAAGVITMPWPEYENVVEEFFLVASRECWRNYDYSPADAKRMIENDDLIKTTDLTHIKTMLTYCVRGEWFFDGLWAAMIEGGYIRRLLERPAEPGLGMPNRALRRTAIPLHSSDFDHCI